MPSFYESVIIKDANGSNAVTLSEATVPWPFPIIPYKRRVTAETMEDSDAVTVVIQSGIKFAPLAFFVKDVTANHSAILSKFIDPNAEYVLVSIDSGVTFFRCCWQEDGYVPRRWQNEFSKIEADFAFFVVKQEA